MSYQTAVPPPAFFLGMELPLPKKEGKMHFLTKDHIDLSFPDIKNNSQVTIESSRNKHNGALAPSTTFINQSAIYKPPLHNVHSASRNDLKVNN